MAQFRSLAAGASCLVLIACASAHAQQTAPQPQMSTPSAAAVASAQAHYAPYAFLIGDWISSPGGDASIRQSFSWGPGQSYIAYNTYTRPSANAPESLHFGGIMVWNGAQQNLDFLFAMEAGTSAQEQGIVRVEADGSVVRDVTMTRGDGGFGTFRQTFRQTGPDSAVTTLMRQTAAGGWEPTFPGADNLVMTRRAS